MDKKKKLLKQIKNYIHFNIDIRNYKNLESYLKDIKIIFL